MSREPEPVHEEQPAELTLYAAPGQRNLFAQFRDATSEKESYGAGRYLEVPYSGDHVLVDFNHAYNPYCAYNFNWSYPCLPPRTGSRCPFEPARRPSSNMPTTDTRAVCS